VAVTHYGYTTATEMHTLQWFTARDFLLNKQKCKTEWMRKVIIRVHREKTELASAGRGEGGGGPELGSMAASGSRAPQGN
jgi:hypothetical protein